MANDKTPSVEWGVLWQVAVVPDGTVPPPPVLPIRPDLPLPKYDVDTGNPIPPEYTAEQQALQDQYVADVAAFNEAVAARDLVVDQVLKEPDNWQTALSIALNEEHAREMLKTLVETNATNKFARDFELATAPARIWTKVDS